MKHVKVLVPSVLVRPNVVIREHQRLMKGHHTPLQRRNDRVGRVRRTYDRAPRALPRPPAAVDAAISVTAFGLGGALRRRSQPRQSTGPRFSYADLTVPQCDCDTCFRSKRLFRVRRRSATSFESAEMSPQAVRRRASRRGFALREIPVRTRSGPCVAPPGSADSCGGFAAVSGVCVIATGAPISAHGGSRGEACNAADFDRCRGRSRGSFRRGARSRVVVRSRPAIRCHAVVPASVSVLASFRQPCVARADVVNGHTPMFE